MIYSLVTSCELLLSYGEKLKKKMEPPLGIPKKLQTLKDLYKPEIHIS